MTEESLSESLKGVEKCAGKESFCSHILGSVLWKIVLCGSLSSQNGAVMLFRSARGCLGMTEYWFLCWGIYTHMFWNCSLIKESQSCEVCTFCFLPRRYYFHLSGLLDGAQKNTVDLRGDQENFTTFSGGFTWTCAAVMALHRLFFIWLVSEEVSTTEVIVSLLFCLQDYTKSTWHKRWSPFGMQIRKNIAPTPDFNSFKFTSFTPGERPANASSLKRWRLNCVVTLHTVK